MRCSWVNEKDELYVRYHDEQWGVPVHDDRLLFEMLVLETFQAGLSWQCILHKHEAFKNAFDNFDVEKVAGYGEVKIQELMATTEIIRNKQKISAAVNNAKIFIKIGKEFGSFDKYLWHWTNGKTVKSDGVETTSILSDKVAKDLKNRGMKFVGSTIIFSYLAAVGVIFAHTKNCTQYNHSFNDKVCYKII